MPERVEIELLGGFAVRFADRVVTADDFERRRGAELVQLLALAPGRRLHREQVIDRLWPDLPLRSALNQFHKASSFARTGLGDRRTIIVRDEHVHLLPDADVTIDVDLVERADPRDADAVAIAREAYRGDLLPATPYGEWAVDARERVRMAYRRLLEAAEEWDELARLDPLHEVAHVELMRRSLESGDRAAVVRRFDELAARLVDEVGVAPGPDATAVRDRALSEPTPAASPGLTTAGRHAETARLLELVAEQRCVTVTGPGGVGKTHLVSSVVERISRVIADVVIAPLGQSSEASGAAQEVLAALGARRQTDTDDEESIVRTIGQSSLVVVLDNCEHVIGIARSLTTRLLTDCPNVRVLATSRIPLDLDPEHTVRLGPLERAASLELFGHEARRHDIELAPDDPRVDRICAAVDDLPLAIRLVAARARSTDLDTLVGLVEHDLGVIGDATAPGHPRTLRESVEWSVDALTPASCRALGSIATFADEFGFDDARVVIGDTDAAGTLAVIDDLVAASLVTVVRSGASIRYRLPEAIRYFAREGVTDDAAQRRHLGHARDRAQAADALLSTDSGGALDAFASIWSDLRSAVHSASDLDDVRSGHEIIAACGMYANYAWAFEILDWCEHLIPPDDAPDDGAHADALAMWCVMLLHRSEVDRADALFDLLGDRWADRPLVAFASGVLLFAEDDAHAAEEVYDAMLARADLAPALESATLTMLGVSRWSTGGDVTSIAHRMATIAPGRGPLFEARHHVTAGLANLSNDPSAAADHFEEAIDIARAHDQLGLLGGNMTLRVLALVRAGRSQDVLVGIRDNLTWARHHGVWSFAIMGLAAAASTLAEMGRIDRAVTLASARVANGFVDRLNGATIDGLIDSARAEHGDATVDAWWSAGERLDARAATDFAIDAIERSLAESG